MELTRKQVIDNLEKFVELRLLTSGFCETELFESLIYAISSLKTDETYQIMYEGGEIFTKADMVAMLEELNKKFDEQYYINRHKLHDDSLNVGLEQGQNIILREINALKGEHT